MRIVGGRLGGRPLQGPSTDRIRPTSDRLRETIFNIIEHGHGGVEGTRVIDLFAGTGALAFEALSRGAQSALLVDDGAEARALIRANVEALGLGGATRIFRRDARKLGSAPPGARFDLAFLDPPYSRNLAEPALAALHGGNWLTDDALVIVEESAGATVSPPGMFTISDRRIVGDTQVLLLRAATRDDPAHPLRQNV